MKAAFDVELLATLVWLRVAYTILDHSLAPFPGTIGIMSGMPLLLLYFGSLEVVKIPGPGVLSRNGELLMSVSFGPVGEESTRGNRETRERTKGHDVS